jgi:hypothetical protein
LGLVVDGGMAAGALGANAPKLVSEARVALRGLRLLIMVLELSFGGQPVIDILAILPSALLVEVIGEASDLVG